MNEPVGPGSDGPGPASAATTSRRAWVGLAATAIAAGAAGWFWQRSQRPGDAPADAAAAWWTMRFERPEGGDFSLADFRGKTVVLNFWGTWCPPCVRELPAFDRLARERRAQGVEVVGLAVDNWAAVQRFLQQQPVSFAIGLAGFEGSALTRELGNDTGGLPYTVLLDRSGRIAWRKAGETDFNELSARLDAGGR